MGYGGAGHDGGYLTDAIQVLHIDLVKTKVAFISIPRDLWIKLPNGSEAKINAVMADSADKKDLINSGAASVKQVVSTITGLPINYFIAVDFVGFQRSVGQNLKGIQVQVGETLDDPWYPIPGEELNTCGKTADEVATMSAKLSGFELEKQFPCRYEHLHFPTGLVSMQGGEALKYVRSRHGSGEGDISRGKRQQEVLLAIGKKLFSLEIFDDLPVFYKTITKNVQTDIDLTSAQYLVPILQKIRDFKTVSVNLGPGNVLVSGTSRDRQAILYPKIGMFDWREIQSFINNQIGEN